MTSSLLFLGDIGGSELILIMVVILIFFGANKIPELARGLGKGIREFKDASSEIRNEFENAGQPRPNQYANQYPPQPQAPYQPQPYDPSQPQYGHVPPTAPAAYEPVHPVYNAADDVNSPAVAHVPHAHDTPLPGSAPANKPRLDQPSPDA
ncbi:Sec-independent protein translocase subunit TatA/TatB [Hymenobacter bucti]|uniref:Sec-independent protein translocase protein TatA n=1 Tax=Hymenobacter bucti TaxID=1844114 RepID=A0ABW4QQC4_9BACT